MPEKQESIQRELSNKPGAIARRGCLSPAKSTAQFAENAVLDKSEDGQPLSEDTFIGPLFQAFAPEATLAQLYRAGIAVALAGGLFLLFNKLFYRRLPKRLRQFRPMRLRAGKLIKPSLQLRDWLRDGGSVFVVQHQPTLATDCA
jgi:hypothetical protein